MKRILCTLLIILTVAVCVFFPVSATAENGNDIEEPEKVYYSDLFYGYSNYLLQSPYLLNYSSKTQQIYNKVYSDYIDSPMFAFSDIKHSLPLVFDIKEYTKLISDLTGLTSFTYEKALDKANEKFAEELMGASALAKTYGTENSWVKNINKFVKVYDTFQKNYKVYEKTEVQIYEETFQYFMDEGAYSYISVTNIQSVKEIVLPKLSEIKKILSVGSDALKGAKTLMLSLMIEDMRFCIVDQILAAQQKNTMLYDGMLRLKQQLSNGFKSYFYYNYVQEEIISKVADFVLEKITDETFFADGGFKLIGAVVNVACYVVFDVIFDVPDIDDLTTQAVLAEYSNDFYYEIYNKVSDFKKQFSNDDISVFETLFAAYQAVNNAAFKATEKITLSGNKKDFEDIKTKYYKEDIFSNYIDDVKKIIKSIPQSKREITNHGVWNINSNVAFRVGTDYFDNDNNNIYVVNNKFLSDIILSQNVSMYFNTDTKVNSIKISNNNAIYSQFNSSVESESIDFENTAKLTIYSGNLTVDNSVILSGNGWYDWSKTIELSGGNMHILNDLNIYAMGICKINNSSNLTVDGNIKLQPGVNGVFSTEYSRLVIYDGTVECLGDFSALRGNSPGYGVMYPLYGEVYLENQNSSLNIDGNLTVDGNYTSNTTGSFVINNGTIRLGGDVTSNSKEAFNYNNGKVILCGENKQSISNFPIYNLSVENSCGIKLNSSIYVYGDFQLNNNPIQCDDNTIYLYSNAKLSKGNYGNISILDDYVLNEPLTILGDFTFNVYDKKFTNNSTLTVRKNFNLLNYTHFNNNGNLIVYGNMINGYAERGYKKYYSILNMNNEKAVIKAGGNIIFEDGGLKVSKGKLILIGESVQNVTASNVSEIIINNTSEDGVVFTTEITPSILFNHNGNKFTLYNDGVGSSFVDYDGDGLKDNIDPEPTVGKPCRVLFESEDIEKGTVSLGEVETFGGTKLTVTATPTFKYNFSKWVDSSGTVVSTSSQYTLIVKNDETFKAIFVKRKRPIFIRTNGGEIISPSIAEIDSEVTVSVAENDGYVYTEGSLAYNGIAIKDNKFIMPDETVTLTAEFIRNENYFSLADAINSAKNYTYENYTKESFENLTTAINAAQRVLVNNITAEESCKYIKLLQSAVDGLKDKYISSIALKWSPTLYVDVPDMINSISIIVTYDNGTTINATGADCVIGGYDPSVLGNQTITVTYNGFVGELNVTVQKRRIFECSISNVTDCVYDGLKDEYTQVPTVAYYRTKETLLKDADYTVTYANNSGIGKATITITGIGRYTGSRTISYNIYCQHNYEIFNRVEATCVKTGYLTEKCSICKKIISYENMFTENLPESEHNYGNNADVSYYYTCEGASSLKLTFSSSTMLETNYDFIYIYNAAGTLLGTYSGNSLSGKYIAVSGDTVRIRLKSDGSVVKYGFSLDSITAYFDELLLPTIEHKYGQWSTIVEATPDTTGLKHKICLECGYEVTEKVPVVDALAFSGASLSLHHNLAINYKADKALFESIGYANPYVVFEIGGKKVTVKNYSVEGDRYVFRFNNIAPNQMNNTIFATLYSRYNGTEYASATKEYSVAEYCYNTLSKYNADSYAKLRTLIVDLLNYGAQSQLYTKYNTDNLANGNLTASELAWGTAEEPILNNSLNIAYKTVDNPLITWKGASLNLNDSVTMKFKFITDDINGLSLKISSEKVEWNIKASSFVLENGVYSVKFSGLNAGQMSEKVYLTMYKDGIAVSNTVCYSIESYAYSKQSSQIEHLADLVKAMMKYGYSAYSYVN